MESTTSADSASIQSTAMGCACMDDLEQCASQPHSPPVDSEPGFEPSSDQEAPTSKPSWERSDTIATLVEKTDAALSICEDVQTAPATEQQPRVKLSFFQRVSRNVRANVGLIIWYAIWLIFSILYLLFVYYVLMQGDVQVDPVFFDASLTNLLVSIFSQVFVILADKSLRSVLSAVRLALAVIGAESLLMLSTIGSTSDWLAILQFLLAGWAPELWRRRSAALLGEGAFLVAWLGLPIMGLAFSSVLKFGATFDYVFKPGTDVVSVFAGLTPLDNRVLDFIPQAILCLYFQSWTAGLLTTNKFATSFPVNGCGEGCRSVILTGGLELARQVSPTLNESIFDDAKFDGAETIRVENATAFVFVFENFQNGTEFNTDNECMFAGQSVNKSLEMCVRQDGEGIMVGWAGCPDMQYNLNRCGDNLTWAASPLKWATKMNVFSQRAATAYDRQNFSIVDVTPLGDMEPLHIEAFDYMAILQKILLPAPQSKPEDLAAVSALVYTLSWLHRLEQVYFPHDQNSLITNLHNLLAIPLQFTVAAKQYTNYTVHMPFPMPSDAETIAAAGSSQNRLVIQPWTGVVFMVFAAMILCLGGAGIATVLTLRDPLPLSTGVGEVDALRHAERIWLRESSPDGSDQRKLSLMNFVQETGEESAWSLAERFRKWRVGGYKMLEGDGTV